MKLLNRSIRSYLFYSIGVILISFPIFYYAIQHLIARDVDHSLKAQKTEILARLQREVNRDPFSMLDIFGPDIMLNRINIYTLHDTLYTVRKLNPDTGAPISYRILESNVLIRGNPYKIVLQNSLVNSEDLIKSIFMIIALLLIGIVGGLLFINRTLSGKLWQPFYKTLQTLRGFRVDGSVLLKLPETDVDEFTALNKVAETLTTTNQKLFESQKEFTENASHEMQTPLAIMQSKLELLMQTNPITEEQAALIADLANASQRMHRLNKSLLLLTRIDNSQFTEREEVEIDKMVSRLAVQYRTLAVQKNITVDLSVAESLKIMTNNTLTEILIGNLLGNAVRHNVDNGRVEVSLSGKTLKVANTGRPETLDETKIFTRFHKESADNNSIGLGLEIVRKICQINGFKIRYQFENHRHIFIVYF